MKYRKVTINDIYFLIELRKKQLIHDKIIATGIIIFYEFSPTYTNKSSIKRYITNMYTAPDYRGHRIARNMLERVVKEARKRKVEKLFLIASRIGRLVYLKYGFSETDEWLKLNNII